MNFKVLTAAVLAPAICSAAIFGVDSRKAVTEQSPMQALARATAVAVLSTNMTVNAQGTIDLDTTPLTRLCSDEKSYAENSLEYSCTGFLIAPDLLVTAGHCVYAVNAPNQELKNETGLACKAFSWLFDYQNSSVGVAATTGIKADRLFGCKQIIYAKQVDRPPYVDYALIQLDRPAFGRTPFKIAQAMGSVGTMVSMIGYPFGTPVKVSDQARITIDNSTRQSFITTLDAFSGNSGSPVLNGGHQVIGILVGGTPSIDTYTDQKNKCERLNRCNESGTSCAYPDADTSKFPGYQGVGSEVQRIDPIVNLLKK